MIKSEHENCFEKYSILENQKFIANFLCNVADCTNNAQTYVIPIV